MQDDASVFCDRCGARLPARAPRVALTCRNCGKTQPDPQSRFCDRCGYLLDQPVKDVSPPVPAVRQVACPACGFVNAGEVLVYCRKCGSSLFRNEPVTEHRRAVTGPARRQQGPAAVPVPVQELPRRRRQETRETGGSFSFRKLAAVAAGVVILLIALAFITGNIPGMQGNVTANKTASQATAPGPFDSLLSGIAGREPVLNQATPVVTDKPLAVKKTPTPQKTITTPEIIPGFFFILPVVFG